MSTARHAKLSPRIRRSSQAVMLAIGMMTIATQVQAGAGWADNVDKAGVPFKQPTYYANSPSGIQAAHDQGAAANATRDTGTPLRKFVDTLPLVDGYSGANLSTLNPVGTTGRHIPMAIKEAVPAGVAAHSVSYPDADFYEIAVVEYREQLHSDLPPVVTVPATKPNYGPAVTGGTTLRGYVQIWTPNLPATTPKTQLYRLDGAPVLDNKGQPVFIVGDQPHYLGPVIDSQSGVPVRIKFDNYLPTGHYDPITKTRGGDVFIPTDFTVPGSGLGPNGALDPNYPQPYERYTQNRTNIHLHGGDTPWISDGEPHDWITPAGEATPYPAGAITQNVPDMPDPGPGSQTYFYPNNQSARMMWYHDHSYASTRIDVYAGIVSAFLIHDATEAALKSPTGGTVTRTDISPNGTSSTSKFTLAGALAGMDEIPLIFEDKTFVPKDIAVQDAKWDTDAWGKYGDLWFPHVYESNQNPNSIDGTNPAGRWDYGPWFWPVFPAPLALPTGEYGNASATQEAFSDTPLLNGIAYPNLSVEPKAYRFRLLNASLQRYLNLGLYTAESATVGILNPGQGYNQGTTVTFSGGFGPDNVTPVTTQATGHVVVDTVTGAIAAIVTDTQGSGYGNAASSAPTITITNGPGAAPTGIDPATKAVYALVPAVTYVKTNTEMPMVDAVMPAANAAYAPNTYDGRPGGIPNPLAIGPNIIQIGTEGGFLAQPNVIPSTPVSYQQLRRIVTVLNILDHGLYVGPAERADFVVDFSQFAGKTLMLYNDCPAPNPGFDARVDYFTGMGDMTSSGGADNVLPGYGPNTRTLMRINVAAQTLAGVTPTAASAYDPLGNGGPLATELPKAFAASQDTPIVPWSWQNTAYGTQYTDNYAHIYAGSYQQPTYNFNAGGTQTITGFNLDSAGAGYTVPPLVTISGGGGTGATAHALLDVAGKRVQSIVLDSPGSGYTGGPTVTLNSLDGGIGASATVLTNATQQVYVSNKGIQELFEPNYGRMNATFSMELPFTSVLTQTTIPVGYVDPPTEQIADGETQFWKVTHNGVDTHVVHFHLFNVQVINRVAWDGTIVALDPAEFGWKETVKMNPLEDIYVAVKPKSPKAPFGVPQSVRYLDPTQAPGASAGFSQVDPKTGLATTVTNALYNFDWEYVWHCHILGHEENDFMRPMIFNFGTAQPPVVTGVSASGQVVTWTDPTPAGAVATYGNKQNEQGFIIQRTDTGSFPALPDTPPQSAAQASLAPKGFLANVVAANATRWVDPVPMKSTTQYRVLAFNSAGYSPNYVPTLAGGAAGTAVATTPASGGKPAAPIIVADNHRVGAYLPLTGGFPVSVSWTTPQYPANGFMIIRSGGFTSNGTAVPDVPLYATVTSTRNNGVTSLTPTVVTSNGDNAGAVAFSVASDGKTYTLVDSTASEMSGYTYTVYADNTPVGKNPSPPPATPVLPSSNPNLLFSPGSFVQVFTPYGTPDVIAGVTAAAESQGNAVRISWDMPAPITPDAANITAYSHVTGFNVVRTDATGKTTTFAVSQQILPLSGNIVPPANTFVDTAPVPGVNSYMVYGVNGNLTGTVDSNVAKLTLSTVAPAVNGAVANAIASNAVVLNWAAAPAGTNVSGVQITRVTAGSATPTTLAVPPGAITSFTDSMVMPNTVYTYSIQWVVLTQPGNVSNLGLAGTTAPVTTPDTPAVPVTALSATAASTGTAVTLTWTPGGPTASFAVTRCVVATGVCSPAGTVAGTASATFTDTSVVPGVAYLYQVQAVNSATNVSLAVSVPISTPAVPYAPVLSATGFTAATATTPLSYTFAIGTAPGSNTVGATTSNQIFVSVNGGLPTLLATVGNVTSYTHVGLAAGNTYTYTVVAVNAVGSSAASKGLAAVALVPNAPTIGVVTVGTNTANAVAATSTLATSTNRVTVRWSPATLPAGAPAITAYTVTAYASGTTTVLAQSSTTGANAATATNLALTLQEGISYQFVVSAVNAIGVGTASGLSATVVDGEAVAVETSATGTAPTLTSTTAAGLETVNLDWTPIGSVPLNANGTSTAVTGYVVQWSNNVNFNQVGGALTVSAAQATAGTVTGTGPSLGGSNVAVTTVGGVKEVTTFTNVNRGTAATPRPVYFRVNAVTAQGTFTGAVTGINATTTPPLQ